MALPIALSANRVPAGITIALLVTPLVMSAELTVTVNSTNAFAVPPLVVTISQSTRWITSPLNVLPFNSAQPFPSNVTPEPSVSTPPVAGL